MTRDRGGIDKAVILAAGGGTRLAGLCQDLPKPLLPLSGEVGGPCFLDWHLWCLARAGVSEVYLVGNDRTCGAHTQAMDSVDARWIANSTPPSASGSGHSTWLAWSSPCAVLDGRSRVLLMDADIVYDPDLLGLLAAADPRRSSVLVNATFDDTGEEVLVYGREGLPCLQGKGLPGTPMVEGLQCLGEATGMVLWEPCDHERLRAITDWVVASSTARTRSEHEDITGHMMRLGRVQAVRFSDRACMEIDTPDDYARLTSVFFPRHLQPWLDRLQSPPATS